MNQDDNYASDSDQSDEDFCPDKEACGPEDSDAVSEEDTDDEVSDKEEADEASQKKQQKAKKSAASTKKKTKKKVNHKSDEIDEVENCRRITRQRDDSNSNGKGIMEKDELESDEEDKSRTDTLWADFLSDVKPVTNSCETTKTGTAAVPRGCIANGTSGECNAEKPKNDPPEVESKQIKVTEVLDFAGEEVKVEKVINADSLKGKKVNVISPVVTGTKSGSQLSTGLKRPAVGGGGSLGSVLSQIGKKKKISVLEKSKLDWNSFKQNEGIEEELQTHNKGKDGYLERQDFLQRTDLRQFEIERGLRQSRRTN